jgi:hypothetical protein
MERGEGGGFVGTRRRLRRAALGLLHYQVISCVFLSFFFFFFFYNGRLHDFTVLIN